MLLIHDFLCIMGILEEICDKSSKTATSENVLLVYCVSDCLACSGLKLMLALFA